MGGPDFEPVVFVDDRNALQGSQINGLGVYAPEDLPHLVVTRKIDRVLLAMPSASHRRRRQSAGRPGASFGSGAVVA